MALKKQIEDLKRALNRLKEAYEMANLMRNSEHYEFFRDSAIQRFEFTVEILWKSIKSFLFEVEGITCRSPKSCIREFLSASYLSPQETTTLLKMVDDRNRTSHTYHEEVAEEIFNNLGGYITAMKKTLRVLEEKIGT
jgi:nucleotidyltransferase substrate binding protein (TIGR01987 family)